MNISLVHTVHEVDTFVFQYMLSQQ